MRQGAAWGAVVAVVVAVAGVCAAGGGGGERSEANTLHFVYGVECNSYMDWQAVAFESSFKAIGQEGKVTRLMACDDPAKVTPGDELGLVSETWVHPRAAHHPFSRDTYSAYNRPYGFHHWFLHHPPAEEIIIIFDPDMFLIRKITLDDLPTPEELKGAPMMQEYTYLAERGFVNGLQKFTVAIEKARPVGVPMFFHRDDLRELNPWWHVVTELVRESPLKSLTLDGGWTSEMYGMAYGLADVGLVPSVHHKLMLYPAYAHATTLPFFMHWGILLKYDNIAFDKHHYMAPATSLIDCAYTDFPAWGHAPPLVHPPRTAGEDCYSARARGTSRVFLHYFEKFMAEERARRGCDHVSLYPIPPDDPPFSSDVIPAIDRAIDCPLEPNTGAADPRFYVASYPPIAYAPPAARRAAALAAPPAAAAVTFAVHSECSPAGDAAALAFGASYAAVDQPHPLLHLRSCSPYATPHKLAFGATEFRERTMAEHHLLGEWEPAYSLPWIVGHWLNPSRADENAKLPAGPIVVLVPDPMLLVRPWDVEATVAHLSGGGEAPAVALAGAPIAALCDAAVVAEAGVADLLGDFTDAPHLLVPACPPYIVHAADLRDIAVEWTSAVRAIRTSGRDDLLPHLRAYAYMIAVANVGLTHMAVTAELASRPQAPAFVSSYLPTPLLAVGSGCNAGTKPWSLAEPKAHPLACDSKWPPADLNPVLSLEAHESGCAGARAEFLLSLCSVVVHSAISSARTTTSGCPPAASAAGLASPLPPGMADGDAFWRSAATAMACPIDSSEPVIPRPAAPTIPAAATPSPSPAPAPVPPRTTTPPPAAATATATPAAATTTPAPAPSPTPASLPVPPPSLPASWSWLGAAGYLFAGAGLAVCLQRSFRIAYRVYEKRRLRERYKLP